MKTLLLILTLLTGVATVSLAQGSEPRPDGSKVEAIKIGWLTKKLSLSPEEAQRFWPIYNRYADDIRKTRLEARTNKTAEIAMEEQLLNIRKKYNDEFGKAMPSEKVNTFFRAEKEFSNYIQKEILERNRQMRLQNQKRLQ